MKTFKEWKKDQTESEVSDSVVVLILLVIMFAVAAIAA
jgi:hypothetical protein